MRSNEQITSVDERSQTIRERELTLWGQVPGRIVFQMDTPDPSFPKVPSPQTAQERRQHNRERIAQYLATKWDGPVVCPVCKTTHWSIGDVVDLPVRDPDFLPDQGYAAQVYPLVPVYCDNCSYVLWFNAISAGADLYYGGFGPDDPWGQIEPPGESSE